MQPESESVTTVAVLSSRATLDLAINTWVPGFAARTRADLDGVVELAGANGIIVVDLASSGEEQTLEELVQRGVRVPVVAVLAPEHDPEALAGDVLVVTAPAGMEDLGAVLAQARERLAVPETCEGTGSLGGSHAPADAVHVIDVREPQEVATGQRSGLSRLLTRLRPRSERVVPEAEAPERIIDLTVEEREQEELADQVPSLDATSTVDGAAAAIAALTGATVASVGVLRAWALLDELNSELGTASAVVTRRSSAGHHVIVAGVDVAAYEAQQLVPADHGILRAIADGQGWLVRHASSAGMLRGLPLGECEQVLAVGVAEDRSQAAPSGLLLAGHFRAFSAAFAEQVLATAADTGRLHHRLRLRWAPEQPLDPATADEESAGIPADLVASGWRLLTQLSSVLPGAAAVAIRDDHGRYIVAAAQFIDPHHAVRVIGPQHPLLARLRDGDGPVLLDTINRGAELLRSVPLPSASHIGVFPVGSVAEPDALLLLAREQAITPEAAATVSELIAASMAGARLEG